jgi:hypothetical protein
MKALWDSGLDFRAEITLARARQQPFFSRGQTSIGRTRAAWAPLPGVTAERQGVFRDGPTG